MPKVLQRIRLNIDVFDLVVQITGNSLKQVATPKFKIIRCLKENDLLKVRKDNLRGGSLRSFSKTITFICKHHK